MNPNSALRVLTVAVLLGIPAGLIAQTTAHSDAQTQDPPSAQPHSSAHSQQHNMSRLPPGLAVLTANSTSRTQFQFDKSMIESAGQYIDNAPSEAKQAAASIKNITVYNYRFADDVEPNQEAMSTIAQAYRSSGWKHLVNKNATADGHAMQTDVWLHFNGTDIDNVSVLAQGGRNTAFITMECDLRPLDLLHLSGHFGIPKMDPNAVMVPDTENK